MKIYQWLKDKVECSNVVVREQKIVHLSRPINVNVMERREGRGEREGGKEEIEGGGEKEKVGRRREREDGNETEVKERGDRGRGREREGGKEERKRGWE